MVEPPSEPTLSIRRAIAERGPISFAEFMELALYGPGGFYERPPVGEHGHFVTSPHVHPLFGELLAGAIRSMWNDLGRPDPLSLIEVGAGDGTLATVIRRSLADVPRRYIAVERSTGARDALRALQPPIRVAASIEELGQRIDGVLVANELLDNLPFRWVRRDARGRLREVLVDARGDRFLPVDRPLGREPEEPHSAAWLARGTEGPLPDGAMHFVERLARMLHRGYALLIDYVPGPRAEIHGYRGQRAVEDVLSGPGTTDITAGVDIDLLSEQAELLGLASFPPVSQSSALRALGYERWADAQLRRQSDAQDARAGREAVETWSGRNAAALLVNPAGLGRLRWWLLAAGDLPAPGWLDEATRLDLEEMAAAPSHGAEGFMWFEDRPRRGLGRKRRT
jgi:SAM-dependent MidA family methyltransferase